MYRRHLCQYKVPLYGFEELQILRTAHLYCPSWSTVSVSSHSERIQRNELYLRRWPQSIVLASKRHPVKTYDFAEILWPRKVKHSSFWIWWLIWNCNDHKMLIFRLYSRSQRRHIEWKGAQYHIGDCVEVTNQYESDYATNVCALSITMLLEWHHMFCVEIIRWRLLRSFMSTMNLKRCRVAPYFGFGEKKRYCIHSV